MQLKRMKETIKLQRAEGSSSGRRKIKLAESHGQVDRGVDADPLLVWYCMFVFQQYSIAAIWDVFCATFISIPLRIVLSLYPYLKRTCMLAVCVTLICYLPQLRFGCLVTMDLDISRTNDKKS
ncbi:hypothetical protein GUJ93_ZPchr0006g45636 [Zizania palustris]|uniref:Uncharacterized protein n=1 Tax=Zizania palustris TaxID=103762 RepID=A0A8J5T9R2_ZIZPA|nr:hypothetical protein GUJ93_ZPchr0006g45636 [Zizania palustris]